ncbi:MAG TPA: hypothetical protein VEB86_00380, partial [Chryseosolibacter sp.]|nr:hypothetical protein [Chryseosolibacter sp.]
MLETIGIKGYYCLIKAGADAAPMDTSFPSSQFNHVIVAVPNVSDTLWLECTSQTNPFGYQGYHTGNRKALMITDNGAAIVNTSRYTADHNLQSRTAEVTVDAAGDAKAKVRTTYSGLQYENDYLDFVVNYEYDEQKKWVESNTAIPSFEIDGFSMNNVKGKVPSAIVNTDLTLRRFATINGKRMFLTPNLMNRSKYIPEKVESRKTNVVIKTPYTDVDTIHYRLPEEIYPEYLPPAVKLQNRFGEYEASFTIDQGSLVYIRRVKMNRGEFPAESYSELIEFYKSISKADNTKVVFLNKT